MAETIEVIVSPAVAAAVAAKNVPIAPVNKHLPTEHTHLSNPLQPLIKLDANNETNNIAIAIADITKAILIKFKVTGIKPKENKTPNITPITTLIIKLKMLHPKLEFCLHSQSPINSPPLIFLMSFIKSYKYNTHLIYYIFKKY